MNKTERPIIFSAPMVRAILEGRKTQTRRAVRHQPPDIAGLYFEDRGGLWWAYMPPGEPAAVDPYRCPYGLPGDRLWVREQWRPWWDDDLYCCIQYRDMSVRKPDIEDDATGYKFADDCDKAPEIKWKSPIFMPRWASRITLEITGIRVERVQEISEDDARAEGISEGCGNDVESCAMDNCRLDIGCPAEMTYRKGFREAWNTINAHRGFSWDANPWVWVIEFKEING